MRFLQCVLVQLTILINLSFNTQRKILKFTLNFEDFTVQILIDYFRKIGSNTHDYIFKLENQN